jgi:hypothetical protein
MAQQPYPGAAEQGYPSGQAGGGTGAVFGDLGGPGQQQGTPVPMDEAPPLNSAGNVTNNPSGDGVAPPQESVFGDPGGGVSSQTGGAQIIAGPAGTDPGGQGGR